MTKTNTIAHDPIFDEDIFRNVKKMPALFVIDRVAHLGINEINPKSAWVFNEPSTVTKKKDGTGITVAQNGEVFARRTVKKGKKAPAGFRLAEFDEFTGHSFGVEPIAGSSLAKFFYEALAAFEGPLEPGTYELVGEKISANPENVKGHVLLRHGAEEVIDFPDMRNVNLDDAFEMLKEIFTDFRKRGIEGVVWAGADNKRVKLRTNDFFGDPNRW